jgi:hypothetical protein
MSVRSLAFAIVLGVSAVGAMGCGGPDSKTAHIQAKDMPEGETWTGVYYHPAYGYLHMVEQDNNTVVGKWRKTDQSAWGRLSGTKTGNVLHFQWTETKYGLVGPSATSKGKGYFVYKMGANEIAELDGQYGLDQDEVGSDWHCIKQQRMQPDLGSITGDVPGGGSSTGGGWEEGTPAPAPSGGGGSN